MAEDLAAIQAAIAAGDAGATERLLPLVYDELRRLAHRHMRREAPGHSLHTTALVHEAYLRLVGPAGAEGVEAQGWDGRAHFLGAAARAMRRILVDRARARTTSKRGGDRRRLDLFDLRELPVDDVPPEVIDLDDALTRLAQEAPEKAELVSLRFFAGLSEKEAAALLGISINTASRHWAFARAWLRAAMDGEL